MGDKSAIEWTDATWNPVLGCTKVSPGCQYCYAITTAARNANFPSMAATYAGLTMQHLDGSRNWTGQVKCLPERLTQPLRWKRPRRIFVNSMADLFHEQVPDSFIAQVYEVMARCPQHTFQVLTKRPERRRALFTGPQRMGTFMGINLPNVWEGTSVEGQLEAEERIPELIATPATVRWLSMEPLLGPVSLWRWLLSSSYGAPPLHWVVVGGESGGPEERRMVRPCQGCTAKERARGFVHSICNGTGWVPKDDALRVVRSIRDTCEAAGVPFLFKQYGGPTHASGGRMLDGLTYDGYPV